MDEQIDVTITIRPVPTLGGGATIGDLRGMCEGKSADAVAGLVEAWVTDRVVAGETDAEALGQAVAPILEPHGLVVRLAIAERTKGPSAEAPEPLGHATSWD